VSFTGETEEKQIKTTNGKTFKMFITEQDKVCWVATVLYAEDKVVNTMNFLDKDRDEAYKQAEKWVRNYIDDKAVIDSLS